MRRHGSVLGLLLAVALALPAAAAVKPRVVIVLPFDASALDRDSQWMGEGVAQLVSLGLAQHPAFIQLDRARLRAVGRPEV